MGGRSTKLSCERCLAPAIARHRLMDDNGVVDVVYSCNDAHCTNNLGVTHWPVIIRDTAFCAYRGGLFANPQHCKCGDMSYTSVQYTYIGQDPTSYHYMPGANYYKGGFSYIEWCGYMDCEARALLPEEVPKDFKFVKSIVSSAGHYFK